MNNNYLWPTSLYQEAMRRKMELDRLKSSLERRRGRWPSGNIHISKRGDYVQYYLKSKEDKSKEQYISKSNVELIDRLIQKKYENDVYKLINQEIQRIEHFLSKSDEHIEKIRGLYSNNPAEIKTHIIPIDVGDEDYVCQWISEEYERKPIAAGKTIFNTNNNEIVRSKSEMNIANMLNKYKIPYRYEYPIKLNGNIIIHPDFTVLNVAKRKVIYWEHRGMMDDREYAKDSVKRIKDYNKNGIFLGDSLIVTEETSSCALGTDEIERIIQHYFL